MVDQPDSGPAPSPAARGIAGLVVANSSLILAILIYMGWTYDNYFFGYFHLRTLDLGFGPLEYALRSLSLFSPDIVLAAVVLIAIMSVRTWGGAGRDYRRVRPRTGYPRGPSAAVGEIYVGPRWC